MPRDMTRVTTQKRRLITVVILFVFPLLTSLDSRGSEERLTLQVYPYAPAENILKHFSPLANYLHSALKKKVTINISKDHREHLVTVGKDMADLSFVGPATYVQIIEKYGAKPLVACLEIKGSPLLQGVIFTSASSSVSSLKDLKGKRFAFGYENSTMSHLVPLSMLQRDGIHLNDLARHTFLSDQHNVALGVLMGDFDAGAVNSGVFDKYKERGLKELAMSPKVSEHLFVARSTLPQGTQESLRTALLGLRRSSHAQAIMSSIRPDMTGFAPVADSDYDSLRVLLRKLEELKPAP